MKTSLASALVATAVTVLIFRYVRPVRNYALGSPDVGIGFSIGQEIAAIRGLIPT